MSKNTIVNLLVMSWAIMFVLYGLEVSANRKLERRAEALQKIVNTSRALECVCDKEK